MDMFVIQRQTAQRAAAVPPPEHCCQGVVLLRLLLDPVLLDLVRGQQHGHGHSHRPQPLHPLGQNSLHRRGHDYITITVQISVVIYREMQRLEVVNGATGISQ